MSEVNMEAAKKVYSSVCSTLDKMGLSYKKAEEDLVVMLGHKGEDMNHNIMIRVDAKRNAINFVEKLPFEIVEEKRIETAAAVCLANYGMVFGKFTYELQESILFELAQAYSDSGIIDEEIIEKMLMALVITVEEYDDKFMALNKGYIDIKAFIEE